MVNSAKSPFLHYSNAPMHEILQVVLYSSPTCNPLDLQTHDLDHEILLDYKTSFQWFSSSYWKIKLSIETSIVLSTFSF